MTEFLDLIGTTELKCAHLLNQIEEFKLDDPLLSKVLQPGMLQFLQAMQAGCASKALQAWEFSEAIQADCVLPLRELIRRQKSDVTESMRSVTMNCAAKMREIERTVKEAEQRYSGEAKAANLKAQALIQIRQRLNEEQMTETRFTLLDHEEQLASLEFDEARGRAQIHEKAYRKAVSEANLLCKGISEKVSLVYS